MKLQEKEEEDESGSVSEILIKILEKMLVGIE